MASSIVIRCPRCGVGDTYVGRYDMDAVFVCARCTNAYLYKESVEYMEKEAAFAERKKSREAKNVDVYLGTIDRLEPDIAPIDASAAYASQAISLKRIADACEAMAASLAKLASPSMIIGTPESVKISILNGMNSLCPLCGEATHLELLPLIGQMVHCEKCEDNYQYDEPQRQMTCFSGCPQCKKYNWTITDHSQRKMTCEGCKMAYEPDYTVYAQGDKPYPNSKIWPEHGR